MAKNRGSCSRFIRLRFKFQFPFNGYNCDITDFRCQFLCKGLLLDMRPCDILILDFHFSRENLDSDFGLQWLKFFLDFLSAHYFGRRYLFLRVAFRIHISVFMHRLAFRFAVFRQQFASRFWIKIPG